MNWFLERPSRLWWTIGLVALLSFLYGLIKALST